MKSNHTPQIKKKTVFVFKSAKRKIPFDTSDPTTTLFTTTTNTSSATGQI